MFLTKSWCFLNRRGPSLEGLKKGGEKASSFGSRANEKGHEAAADGIETVGVGEEAQGRQGKPNCSELSRVRKAARSLKQVEKTQEITGMNAYFKNT